MYGYKLVNVILGVICFILLCSLGYMVERESYYRGEYYDLVEKLQDRNLGGYKADKYGELYFTITR